MYTNVRKYWSKEDKLLITGFVTRLTQWVPLVEQELLTLLEHLSSFPIFKGVCVTRSLVFCVMFCRSLFVLLSFYFLSLYCLSSDLQILITPLVTSNSSCKTLFDCWKCNYRDGENMFKHCHI